ncbi:MAG: M48 family peptidase [Acidobacteriota bacterium]
MSDCRHLELQRAFVDCYLRIKGSEVPAFTVEFYPYSSLRHTIRLRAGRVLIRISDILSEAPEPVLRALVSILVHRLYRRRSPSEQDAVYSHYANSPEVRQKARQVRGKRGRKQIESPRGKTFDLEALFSKLNFEYFDDCIKVSRIGWSPNRSKRLLGHYDPAHRTIVVSRSLDHPLVPQYVVEYVLYHEMLHVVFDDGTGNGLKRVHHKGFREAEKRFRRYAAAQAFIRTEL